MGLVVPDVVEIEILNVRLTPSLTMRLFSNNATPTGGSAAATFTEVTGGGYVNKPLIFANWTVSSGSLAVYNALQEWVFTGVTGGPGTIYGYYVTRDSDGLLQWAERFPSANVPFNPIAGSIIRVLPRLTCESAF